MADGFLDADQIRAATFVRHVELHETLGSTNDRAAEVARDPSVELPALIVARRQTAGRGRGRNKWWSADGALTFSLLLDSQAMGISTQNWPQLSLATAVAVCDAIERGIDGRDANSPCCPAIKWPNDVYIGGKKVAGILIESPAGSELNKNRLIIGIGVNINNSLRDAPVEIGSAGTALCDVTGSCHDAQATLVSALQAMQNRCAQLARDDRQLPQTWQRLCWLTGKQVEVQTNNGQITGTCAGIDMRGDLIVANSEGTRRIRSGSARVIC